MNNYNEKYIILCIRTRFVIVRLTTPFLYQSYLIQKFYLNELLLRILDKIHVEILNVLNVHEKLKLLHLR